eukprot:CAMPEP_0194166876 /NCGR_PEP_ID=MMETSP0154-20130528/2371_1 /TAXON_ID=1049557 /ORGANISM="Thalassiothrix antarctica, Strain L6-D1" /LENGTH=579 /DNA_ID=CAMNT_0038877677 /DNA_START=198 /DNA_END=1934 /DNA_ORIENTATION=+
MRDFMFNEEKKDELPEQNDNNCSGPISVAVIGAGPSGLALCHALESLKFTSNRDVLVTCFERSSVPGGVWQTKGDCNNETTKMYDNLWTNGPSHNLEFHDYTFDEHFNNKPVTVYMKRQDLLDYILARVTRNCPNFFEKYIRFESEVTNVVFNEAKQMFDIEVKDTKADTMTSYQFHKFVWACGDNGKPKIPMNVKSLLVNGGFKGKIIHSSETSTLEDDVRGKRVVLVGAGYSAEDLALQAVKCGASRVFILSRNPDGSLGTMCSHWPGKKVRVYWGYSISGVLDGGNSIGCKALEGKWPYGYQEIPDKASLPIRNIDTIIFCTGYHCSTDMVDKSLTKGFPNGSYCEDYNYQMLKDWKMKPNNLTSLIGDIKPDVRYVDPSTINLAYHRGVNISNPNMMMLSDFGFDVPLRSIDIHAHLLAQYLNGMVRVLSRQEMEDDNEQQFLQEMQYTHRRYNYDKNYAKAVDEQDLWEDYFEGEEDALLGKFGQEEMEVLQRFLGKVAREGRHPLQLLTKKGKFSKTSKAMLRMENLSLDHRTEMDPQGEEKKWMTYRDYTDGDQFQSLITGTKSQKTLSGKW